MGTSIRTFVCGLLLPGLGYLIVNRPRLGFATILLVYAAVLAVSWTRLGLTPTGYFASIGALVVVIVCSALHAAYIDKVEIEGDRKWRRVVIYAVGFTVISLLISVFRGSILGIESYRVPSQSMAPTVPRDGRIVVDTWVYKDSQPMFGDVVVFVAPDNGISYVKRVVGVPGDRISLTGSLLDRNGEFVLEPYATYEGSGSVIQPVDEVEVQSGQYLLLGDNRNKSRDSRHFGMVPKENIIGKVAFNW